MTSLENLAESGIRVVHETLGFDTPGFRTGKLPVSYWYFTSPSGGVFIEVTYLSCDDVRASKIAVIFDSTKTILC